MSSAVKAVRYLLAHAPSVTAVVPSDRIVASRLPQNIQLPAIVVSHISTIRRPVVRRDATDFCTSRVQVTVFARPYPEQVRVGKLVREALPPTRGDVSGVDVDDIQLLSEGPDVADDSANIFMGFADFRVTFNE